ncbi:hypothetical protein [Desulfonatronum thioautotrophicum]|uniref:hypothetical protein n=1 Tax=Desulfonatronum thioautotrophicum TaxID=617001 RepID=UPI0005EB20E9|nr:hypothetical protein [Desulfonatronum thioautotrophicum]
MDMNKDLATAIVSQRCNCYDSSLESIKRAVNSAALPPDQIASARTIVKSLGAWYFRQHCMENIMECYDLLRRLPPEDAVNVARQTDSPSVSDEQSRKVCTRLEPDVQELFDALLNLPENKNRGEADLLREAVSSLILKYSMDETIREKVLAKAEKLFS